MYKKISIGIGVIVLIGIIWFFSSSDDKETFTATIAKGSFSVKITTSGELEAKNSVPILGPSGLRAFRIWQIKIEDLVDEGTIVKKGEFVGSLDKSQIADKYSEESSELLKMESQFTQTKLETTLNMNQARNEIRDAEYSVREANIALTQSKYEPPATIRKAEIALEKAKKSLRDAKKKYSIKGKQSRAKMEEVRVNIDLAEKKLENIDNLVEKLTIIAPENGMVIYERDWNGQKKGPGSMMNTWNPKIASLPDLTSMVSKTFINEVEISKIKEGQKVNINLDAFKNKKMKGVVKSVSNVGQQNPNSDGKVFEISIEIASSDSTLRPSMTTSNEIIINEYSDVLSAPLEGVFNQGDSLNYVLMESGLKVIKQEVELGESNDDFVIIENGLTEGDEIMLNSPENVNELEVQKIK